MFLYASSDFEGQFALKKKGWEHRFLELPLAKIKRTMEVDLLILQRALQRLNDVDIIFTSHGNKSTKNLSLLEFTLNPLQGGRLDANSKRQMCEIN
jgi:hypothetical protein